MENKPLSPDILDRVRKLEQKYAAMGQDLRSYLDGLLYADYLTYWDYVHLDVLLSLQTPKTPIKDEMIFIVYHQITELYFKLSLHAIEQIANTKDITVDFFTEQIRRINSYFQNLIRSFEIMIEGMDKEQFLQFRMSLLPASGFQSVQYRMIEICSTMMENLVALPFRQDLKDATIDMHTKYQHLYWKQGAIELATNKKTLTLKQFDKKYSAKLIRLARNYKEKNIWATYKSLSIEQQQTPELVEQLRLFDENANIYWPLMHYKSAVRYLQRDPVTIKATGGTNWQKYLPPKNQRIVFYPELWTAEEKDDWGKKMVRYLRS